MEKDIHFLDATKKCDPQCGKRVRWSVDLEEIFYYVPSDGIGKRIQKRMRRLKEKASNAMKERHYHFLPELSDGRTTFDKLLETGFEIFTNKLQCRSKALDFERIRDLGDRNWDKLFEQYSVREHRNDVEEVNDSATIEGTSTELNK